MTDEQEFIEAKQDREKYEQFIQKFLPITRKYAGKFARYGDYEDLCQEGAIGLLIAFEKFDIEKGVSFNHYCRYWVRNRIQEFLWKKSLVRITREAFLNGDIPKSSGDEPLMFQESMMMSAFEILVDKELAITVRMVLTKLGEREQKILKMYFGIEEDPKTYQAIGDLLGYSKQRIQQIVRKALDAITKSLEREIEWKS